MPTITITRRGIAELEHEQARLKQRLQDLSDTMHTSGSASLDIDLSSVTLSEKWELQKNLARVEGLLHRAQPIDPSLTPVNTVGLGSTVVLASTGQRQRITLVSSAEADPLQGLVSAESPLGRAIFGRRTGEHIAVPTPKHTRHYTITTVQANG